MPAAEDRENAVRTIPYVDLAAQFEEERDDLLPAITAALARGDYIGGQAVVDLEHALADYHGVAEAVCLNSGTDALMLGMACLGIGHGDEVITPANSFVASAAAVAHIGATPVLVDVQDDQNIDPQAVARAIGPRTKAIMPVHLTGRMADMAPLLKLAEDHGLHIVEDAAQAIGSRYQGRLSGTMGSVGCFSAHPLKNLNACGDAGFFVTDDHDLAVRARLFRNHGLVDRNTVGRFGVVSRMDTLQASILLVRLQRLRGVIERRRRNAAVYRDLLDTRHVFIPPCRDIEFNTFHTFVIQVDRRDALQAHLAGLGIGSAIHYAVPIHLQPAARELGYELGSFPNAEAQAARILTLPINQFLSSDDVARVAEAVNSFFQA